MASRPDLKPKTRVSYESLLRNRVLPVFGRRQLSRIRPIDIQEFFTAAQVERIAATIRPPYDVLIYVLAYGGLRAAHAAAMQQFFTMFPDVQVENDPYPIRFGSGDWITVVSRTTA